MHAPLQALQTATSLSSAQTSSPPSGEQNHLRAQLSPKPASAGPDEFKATLEEVRSNRRGEVTCSIPVVNLKSFLGYLLPPLRDGIDVESVMASLRDEGSITSAGDWRAFKDNREEKGNSDETFSAAFLETFRAVVDTASRQANTEPTFVFVVATNVPSKDQRTRKTNPGGYIILREAEQRSEGNRGRTRWWYDIALTTEFRRKDNAWARNVVSTCFS